MHVPQHFAKFLRPGVNPKGGGGGGGNFRFVVAEKKSDEPQNTQEELEDK